jgi:erythromycin esterase
VASRRLFKARTLLIHLHDMNRTRWAAILLAFAASRATALAQQDDTALFVRWAKEHASPILGVEVGRQAGDLKSLKSAIGKARVVALGENAHGVHELLEFRNRLFEFLVQEMGFTAIAVETGFAESMPANDFVSGGAGSSSQLAHNVFQWLPGAFDENRELIEWMRAYNERPSTHRKIRLYGIDLTGGFLGAMIPKRRSRCRSDILIKPTPFPPSSFAADWSRFLVGLATVVIER